MRGDRSALTATIAGLAVAGAGCGQLLGVDEYRTSGPSAPRCDDLLKAGAECDRVVGVDECAEYFDADDRGGCVARLPAARCAEGESASPGVLQCRDFSAAWCSVGPFRDDVLLVEAGATDGGDGSAARPYARIQDAIDAASADRQVHVAAGTYAEALRIDKPIVVFGDCAGTTRIMPPAAAPAVIVEATGTVTLGSLGLIVSPRRAPS